MGDSYRKRLGKTFPGKNHAVFGKELLRIQGIVYNRHVLEGRRTRQSGREWLACFNDVRLDKVFVTIAKVNQTRFGRLGRRNRREGRLKDMGRR